MVAALEMVQTFIPGRICDIEDIKAGWGGIMAASAFQLVLTIPMTRNRYA
jgi:hypothetical protein